VFILNRTSWLLQFGHLGMFFTFGYFEPILITILRPNPKLYIKSYEHIQRGEVNILEMEILKTLLAREDISIYELNKILGKNYVTVWRHVKRMLDDGLLKMKYGESGRITELLQVTDKGIATVLLKGNLSEKELFDIGRKGSQIDFPDLSLQETNFIAECFADSLIEIKPKVNLEFFDEQWFKEVFRNATVKAIAKGVKKHRKEFEEKGIWISREEYVKEREEFWKVFLRSWKKHGGVVFEEPKWNE
jgi:DNA-binding MarR family transcriptional regulator